MAAVDGYFLGEPDDLGHQTHLFLDDSSIEDRWDAERVQNEPVKHPRNPVVLADLPWEVSVNAPSVLYDDDAGLFRMWYSLPSNAAWTRESTGLARKPREYGPYVMSYAESEDGVTWHKPLFDRFPFAEWNRTNIVYTGVGGGKGRVAGFVVKPSPEPLARHGRFMCSYKDDRFDRRFQQEELNDYLAAGHTCLAFSDDGVAWRPYEGNPLCPCLDTMQDLHWDERLGLYVLASARPFARAATEDLYRELGGAIRSGQALSLTRGAVGSGGTLAGIGRAGSVENVRTRIAVTLSPDLKTWHPPREVLIPDAADDAEQMFFDHMTMNRCGDQYVGFLSVAARDGDRNGRLELTSSPDGIRWHRPRDRKPLLTPGENGEWDGGHVWSIKNAVPYGEWLYLYYAGSSRPWRYRYPDNTRAIGLARIRRDRFAGYYGGVEGGHLISRETRVTGPQLLVNCSAQHRAFSREWHGSLHTELVERTGRAIPGYTYADCDPNLMDDTAVPLTWRGMNVSALMGRSVYIRFFMRNMFVFGFRFGPADRSSDS